MALHGRRGPGEAVRHVLCLLLASATGSPRSGRSERPYRNHLRVERANDVCLCCWYKPTIVRPKWIGEHGVGHDSLVRLYDQPRTLQRWITKREFTKTYLK